MLINGFNLVHYLAGRGLIEYDDFFREGLSIVPLQSRNFSFKVTIPDKTFLFVKQVDFPEPGKIETLKMEATCYWLAKNEDSLHALAEIFPSFIYYDTHHHILITEQVVNSSDLHAFFRQENQYDPNIGHILGKVLATYHKGMYELIVNHNSQQLFHRSVPSPFTLFGDQLPNMHPRTDIEREMKEMILSQPDFKTKVAAAKNKWEVTALIHGDIKFQNFLIARQNDMQIKLIDWEVADLGDPLWDCAAILQSYILPWIFHQHDERAPQIYRDFYAALPSIHAFWQSYQENVGQLIPSTTKLVEYCAIKLLHTCYESHIHASKISDAGAQLLQLSLNMLSDPEKVMNEFFELNTLSHA